MAESGDSSKPNIVLVLMDKFFYDRVTDPKEEHPISAYIADTWVDYPLYQVLEDFEESLAEDSGTPGPRW